MLILVLAWCDQASSRAVVSSFDYGSCVKRAESGELVLFRELHQWAWDWGHRQQANKSSRLPWMHQPGPQFFWYDVLFHNWVKNYDKIWSHVADVRWNQTYQWNDPAVKKFQQQQQQQANTNSTRALIMYMGSADACSVLSAPFPEHMKKQKIVLIGAFGDGMNYGLLNEVYVPNCPALKPRGMYRFFQFLKDPRIVVWVTFGASMAHPKIINLPIGAKMDMSKMYLPCTKHVTFDAYYECCLIHVSRQFVYKKTKLVTAAFAEYGYRNIVMPHINKIFKVENLGRINTSSTRKDRTKSSLMESKFSISPVGEGDDCYRNYEAIFYGNIPVIERRALERTYDGLPVFMIDNYFIDITSGNRLNRNYAELVCDPTRRHWEKLTVGGWMRFIREIAVTLQVPIYNNALQFASSSSPSATSTCEEDAMMVTIGNAVIHPSTQFLLVQPFHLIIFLLFLTALGTSSVMIFFLCRGKRPCGCQ